jgi:hypothetical protein
MLHSIEKLIFVNLVFWAISVVYRWVRSWL